MADYLSRYSNGTRMVEDFEIPAPFVSSHSLRTVEAGIETQDHLVVSLAESGEADPEYTELLKFITGEVKKIGNNSSYTDCR